MRGRHSRQRHEPGGAPHEIGRPAALDVRASRSIGGVYRISGFHDLGPSVELSGTAPDILIARAREAARSINDQLAAKRR
jgi:hypothetical protein